MVVEYIPAIKTAWETAKTLKMAADSIGDAHIKLQIAELIGALADAKIEASEKDEKIIALEERLKKLEQQEDRRKLLRVRKNVYVAVNNEVEGYGEGPWCTNCFDTKSVLVTLHHKCNSAMAVGNASFSSYVWECPSCKSSVRAEKER